MLFLSLNKSVFLDKLPCSNNLRVSGFINAPLINKQLFGFFKPQYSDLHTQFVCPHRPAEAFDGANAPL